MTLSEKFHDLYRQLDTNPDLTGKIINLIENAPDTSEREGLRALMYHDGIGYALDYDKSFEMAEKAVEGGDPLGFFMLGYMCDNIETPDQAHGGPQQKYDHYDAERFYAKCAEIESRWQPCAILWLGEYYMDMAKGGDPEIAVEYYESIADNNAEAAARLSDYYWDLIMLNFFEDDECCSQLFKWTSVAAKFNPEEYSYRMGWIYAHGLGCKKSREKAFDFFHEAYLHGDENGADAIAKIYEEYLDENPEIADNEKLEYQKEIEYWKNMAKTPFQDNSEMEFLKF